MKALILISALLAGAAIADVPVLKEVPISHVYTPQGFDDNDVSEVVITGYLPNLCYKSPQSTVKKIGRTIHINVTTLYHEPSSYYCPQMIVPFMHKVELGVLDRGDYRIFVNSQSVNGQTGALNIAAATAASRDDYIYASIDHLEVINDNRHVAVVGHLPSNCLAFDRHEWVSNGKDVLALLTIMKQTNDICRPNRTPFRYEFEVPKTLNRDEILIHARSMEGKSVNVLIDRSEEN